MEPTKDPYTPAPLPEALSNNLCSSFQILLLPDTYDISIQSLKLRHKTEQYHLPCYGGMQTIIVYHTIPTFEVFFNSSSVPRDGLGRRQKLPAPMARLKLWNVRQQGGDMRFVHSHTSGNHQIHTHVTVPKRLYSHSPSHDKHSC